MLKYMRQSMNLRAVVALASSIRIFEADAPLALRDLLVPKKLVVSFINAHAVNLACSDPSFLDALMRADLRLRDGSGVGFLLKNFGIRPGLNMNGTDFIPRILEAFRGHHIALYGSSLAVASAASEKLLRSGSAKVTFSDGFQCPDYYLERIRLERPRIVVLGMGMPRQELLANDIPSDPNFPVLVINGGAILDFLAGRFPRAPLSMRRLGMEWLYRFYLEPARLWRRYLLGNAIFIARILMAPKPLNLASSRPQPTSSTESR